MNPELLDAAVISVLGSFCSKAAAFVGKNMFGYADAAGYSISNLGKTTSDVITDAVFIPAASPAIKVMSGVLTVNGKMNICTIRKE